MKDNARTIKYDSITSYAKEYGVEYLSNENLIASIIGIDPMLQGNEPIRKIFDGSHSLRKASKRTLQELTSIKGIGEKKATAILAAFELGRLTHNAFLVNMNGESYRLKETKKFNEQNR